MGFFTAVSPLWMLQLGKMFVKGLSGGSLSLHHLSVLIIVIVCGVIGLLFIVHPKVNKINIHLDDDCGFAPETRNFPTDFVLQWKRQKRGERIGPDWYGRLRDSVRGRQFPLTFDLAGNKITIVVDCCVNGVPSYIGSVGKRSGFNSDRLPILGVAFLTWSARDCRFESESNRFCGR